MLYNFVISIFSNLFQNAVASSVNKGIQKSSLSAAVKHFFLLVGLFLAVVVIGLCIFLSYINQAHSTPASTEDSVSHYVPSSEDTESDNTDSQNEDQYPAPTNIDENGNIVNEHPNDVMYSAMVRAEYDCLGLHYKTNTNDFNKCVSDMMR